MRNDPKTRAFEICLEKMQSGASLEQALGLYPYWAEDLRPWLEAAQAARWLSATIQVPQAAQELSRASLLQAAQSTQLRDKPPRVVSPRLFRLALLALALILLAGALGVAMTSAMALPGEALYPVKIGVERARMQLADSPSQRLEMQRAFDQKRIQEAEVLIERAREAGAAPENAAKFPVELTFAGGLSQIQSNAWMVGGLRVLVPADTQVIGQIKTGIYVEVQGALQSDGRLLARRIRAWEFEIDARLQNRLGSQWVIGGVGVLVTPETAIRGEPEIGSLLLVKANLLLDGSLFARLVEVVEQ